MRRQSPFQPEDLAELEAFYERATAIVAMEDVADGFTDRNMIGVRHDVDNEIGPAVAMARWEAERGHRSTYFILHTAPYWQDKLGLRVALELIAGFGHELGLHLNAVTESIRTGQPVCDVIEGAVGELRGYGHRIRGVVAHGDQACHTYRFVNDEVFLESPRPDWGEPDRTIAGVKLAPVSRALFGFEYDPNWLPRARYLSDSGGRWSQPFESVEAGFPYDGQLHLLVHPDWWAEAFTREEAMAR